MRQHICTVVMYLTLYKIMIKDVHVCMYVDVEYVCMLSCLAD